MQQPSVGKKAFYSPCMSGDNVGFRLREDFIT